ncbi:hypothetical protein ACLMAJ_30990 [Nocardia sp. KC 131]|uniref:hypothetical protein n=1 Tax=Nocardia arseniciresistens TaxID=3392119 RepID=UPI00398E4BFE
MNTDSTAVPTVDDVRRRVLERRERHHNRSVPIRALVVVGGIALGVAAVALFWAPELGLPLLIVSLRLLALEFDRAIPAQVWAERRLIRVRAWLKGDSRAKQITIWVVVGLIAAAVLLRFM